MSSNESLVEAIKLITGAIAEQLDRQSLLDELHVVLVTVRDEGRADSETVRVLQAVIDYLQAAADVDQIRFQRSVP